MASGNAIQPFQTTEINGKGESSRPLSRVARKRQETRRRIITEAERLMRTRPVEEITIQDITEAADVGHGTFYLHFKSKYEVLIPIIQDLALSWDKILQEHLESMSDPAEMVSLSTRHMARIISADPLWRWMLEYSGMPVEDMRDTIGRFAARDFGRGLLSGRFQVPDLGLASSFMVGAFVNSLLASVEAEDPERTIDRMTELMLIVLGIDAREAEVIAHLPLTRLPIAPPMKD